MLLKDLKVGDCWRFTDKRTKDRKPGVTTRYDDAEPDDLPESWDDYGVKDLRENCPYYRQHQDYEVELLKHYSTHRTPCVLSCVDPLQDLRNMIFVLEEQHVDGVKGRECLVRFEQAQRTESIARTTVDPPRYVSTNAECGLTYQQIEHARDLWRHMLKLRTLETAQADAGKVKTVVNDYGEDRP